jgi:hypothetical protein
MFNLIAKFKKMKNLEMGRPIHENIDPRNQFPISELGKTYDYICAKCTREIQTLSDFIQNILN